MTPLRRRRSDRVIFNLNLCIFRNEHSIKMSKMWQLSGIRSTFLEVRFLLWVPIYEIYTYRIYEYRIYSYNKNNLENCQWPVYDYYTLGPSCGKPWNWIIFFFNYMYIILLLYFSRSNVNLALVFDMHIYHNASLQLRWGYFFIYIYSDRGRNIILYSCYIKWSTDIWRCETPILYFKRVTGTW